MAIHEKKKTESQGGKKLTEEEIRSIAAAVKSLTDQDKEKQKISQQLNGLQRDVGEIRKEVDGVHNKGVGKEDIDGLLDGKMDGIKEKIGEVVKQVQNIRTTVEEAGKKKTLPDGIEPLEDMTAEKRKGMNEEKDKIRDIGVKRILDYFRVSDNDAARKILKDKVNLAGLAKKPSLREAVLNSLTPEEKAKAVVVASNDTELRIKLEEEEGIRLYKREGEKWRRLDGVLAKQKKEKESFL